MPKYIAFLLCLLLHPGIAGASPLTLQQCLSRAATANTALKAATLDEKIAAENVRLAETGYLPRVDLQGGYIAQQAPQAVKFGPSSFATQEADFAFANFAIYQTLYDFGRTASRSRQASLQQEAIRHGVQGQEQDLFLQVVQAYYGILQGQKLLFASEEEVRQMAAHQRVAQTLYEQGVVTRNDLLQAEVRLANSRQSSLSAANRLENGWLLLNYLTGQPAGYRGDLEEPARHEIGATIDIMTEIALRKRPEIMAAKKVVQAEESVVQETKAAYYPELFARLALDYTQNSKVQEQAIMSATVGLKVNLFDGYATTARKRQALTLKAREEERLRDLEAKVRLELQTALNDLKVAGERIAVAEKAIRQSEENLRINNDRYLEKVGTATEVIDAQTLLTQTRTEHYRAVFDYQVAEARIKRAMGEL